MGNSVRHLYAFGPFTLDPAERLLLRGEQRLDLPPRTIDTLIVLAENQGRLLEKSDLMNRVWADAAVEENNLAQAIHQLRRALQDGENGTQYIETVPKRGYRLAAPVHLIEHPASNSKKESPAEAAATPELGISGDPISVEISAVEKTGRWRWAALTAVLVLVAVGLLWRWYGASSPIRSLAVLPLQNLSSDQNQEYFADGMTDELITDLAQIRELKVVSKTSVMQYKDARKSLPQIGRELGVDAVVEGSVLRSGDHVRITAQLIRASNDRHLWAQSYEGDIHNVLELQAHVAEAITDEVRLSLDADEQRRLHAARNYDPEAYDLYLRGRYVFRRRNVDAFHEAMGYYEQAAAKDPNFPLAYSGLADCYTLLALFGEGYRAVPDAISNARHALALDETLAESHTSLGAAYVLDWKWADAEKEFRRAIELNPNDVQAHHWYANLYLDPVGRHAEAVAEQNRALALEPMSLVVNTDLGYSYFLGGSYDAALQQYQKVLTMDPRFVPAHFHLMQYYEQRGMYPEEMHELIEDDTLSGRTVAADNIRRLLNDPEKLYTSVTQTGGRMGESEQNLAFSPVAVAGAELKLHRNDLALAALRQSVAERETSMIYLKVDPLWRPLHGTPEFQELLRTVGLADGRETPGAKSPY
jgi:TolB-like protein/DNA-binding winged helix-turn-helix (wHTH) protein